MKSNKLLTATVATLATLFLSISLIGREEKSNHDSDCEDDDDYAVHRLEQSTSSSHSLGFHPESNIDTGGSNVLHRHISSLPALNELVKLCRSSVGTINTEVEYYTSKSNIRMSSDPLRTTPSTLHPTNYLQESHEVLTETPLSHYPSASPNLPAIANDPESRGEAEQDVPGSGGGGNHVQPEAIQQLEGTSAEVASYELKRTLGTGWVRLDAMKDEDFNLFD